MGLRQWLSRWLGAPPAVAPTESAEVAALRAMGAVKLAEAEDGPKAEAGDVAGYEMVGAIALPHSDAALLAVVAEVAVVGPGNIDLRLSSAEGVVLDHAICAPEAGRHRFALFAPPEAGLVLTLASDDSAARVVGQVLLGLPGAALDPARLVPRAPLLPDAGWGRAYGHPPAGDAVGRLRERAFGLLDAPALVEVLDGLSVWLEPGDELSRALMLSGLYEPETLLVLRGLLPEGGVFVDVGGHCGMMTLFGARCVGPAGQVLAFEPSPREFARLRANVAANGFAQVALHQAAMAEAPGTVVLRLAEAGHAGHNTIGSGFAYAGVAVAELVEVPATTLDAALAGLARCDVIKMDVEGAELRALRGGAAQIARLRPALVLEVFDAALAGHGGTVAELMDWLEAQGYDTHDIDPATARLVRPAQVGVGESKNIVALPRK